jgi:hypothetical protein
MGAGSVGETSSSPSRVTIRNGQEVNLAVLSMEDFCDLSKPLVGAMTVVKAGRGKVSDGMGEKNG